MRREKIIFFKEKWQAERFIQLYGGSLVYDQVSLFYYLSYFNNLNIQDYYAVIIRLTTDEINQIIEVIDLKKKVWNGRRCWFYNETDEKRIKAYH